MSITLMVPGVPVSQPRQRHRICAMHGRATVINYTPANDPVQSYKALIRLVCSQEYTGTPITSPLRVYVNAVFPRPKSKCRKRGNIREPKTSKPDVDNLLKSIFDALNGILWHDDAVISSATICKDICGDGEQPHTLIMVEHV